MDRIIEEIKFFFIVLYLSDLCGKIFLYDEKNINTKETYYYIILKVKKTIVQYHIPHTVF